MLEQVGGWTGWWSTYQRLGRVEPAARAAGPELAGGDVLALQPSRPPPACSCGVQLAQALPPVALDRDLLAGALENVVRNAFEALPGGRVTVRTERDELPPRRRTAWCSRCRTPAWE